ETPQGPGIDVSRRANLVDRPRRPHQDATAFFRSNAHRFFQKCGNYTTCHPNSHAHLLPVITGESIIEGVIEPGGDRLDKALAVASGLTRERVKARIGEGRVTLGGQPASQPSMKPAEGTQFRIAVPQAAPAEAEAQDIPLTIVHEDEHLLVVDKPA